MNFLRMGIIKRRAVPLKTEDESMDLLTFVEKKLEFVPDSFQRQILGKRHHRLILNCTRQWGKSTIIAAAAVHRAATEAGSLILVASPTERQSAEFLRKAAGFVRKLGIRVRGDGDNKISLLFPNGSRIVGLPGTEPTVRGFSNVSLLVIDEAARVGDDLYRALRPMLAAANGDLWLMSTPCGKRGFFYHTWTNGGDRWFRLAVPATECARIDPEFLEEERETMTEFWFKQEYLCEFSDVESSLFDRDLVMACFTREIQALDL